MPPDLLGPLGLTVALAAAVGVLWRKREEAITALIAALTAERDGYKAVVDRQQATIERQTVVWDRLADRIEDVLDLVRPK